MKKQRKPPLNIRLLKKINNDVQYIKNELPATIEDICNEVIWLNKGKLMMRGNPSDVIAAYREFVDARKSASSDEDV